MRTDKAAVYIFGYFNFGKFPFAIAFDYLHCLDDRLNNISAATYQSIVKIMFEMDDVHRT